MINHFRNITESYPTKRLMSVDLIRGLTIFAMILVNNPGSWANIYSPLAHASWHGWTLTDLVFPFFLFIVGISITLSFEQSNNSVTGNAKYHSPKISRIELTQIFKRTLKLFLLGWLLGISYYNFYDPNFNWFTDRLLSIRWFGVLQRIAIVYCICAICYRLFNTRQLIWLSILLLVIYWGLMMLAPYQDQAGNQYYGLLLEGNNLAAFIDDYLFGREHLYHKSTQPFASDPEGLLTTLPALVNCLIGVVVAKQILLTSKQSNDSLNPISTSDNFKQFLLSWFHSDSSSKATKLIACAVPLLIFAYLASIWFPINKNLWSPSYVLLSSGLAMLVLALAVWLVDIKGYKLWTAPFLVFGNNAIALFMLSGFIARLLIMIKTDGVSLKTSIYAYFSLISDEAKFNSLIFAIAFMLFMYWPLYWMYRKRIFWKV